MVFNKTVGLRDAWAKKEPKKTQPTTNQPVSQAPKRKAIDVIKQLGKKYTNLPEAKQQKVKAEIKTLAHDVSYEDLEPLFNTAAKKVGTRIAVALTLKVLLDNGLEKNEQIDVFITTAKTDAHSLLSEVADQI